VLDYDFTKNSQFAAKTDRNSVFLWCDPHILDREYLMVPYMSFYRFLKNSNFHSKYVGVSIRLYRKSSVSGQNWPKLSISWLCLPYYRLVIHNYPIYEFLAVLKKLKFSLKIHRCCLRFYRKSPVWGINWLKLSISWSRSPYCGSVIHNSPVYVFLYVLKKLKFSFKICRC
jgi:hypothetical protein